MGNACRLRRVEALQSVGVTLILFREDERIAAEVVGPCGARDQVLPMPDALLLARERAGATGWLAVLDDEDLWQPEWGELPSRVGPTVRHVADGLEEREVPTWLSAVVRAEARKVTASADRLAALALPRAADAAATAASLLFRSADRLAAAEKLRLAELRAWLGLRRVMREHWLARRGFNDGTGRPTVPARPPGRHPHGGV